jgi:hypothetical protein
VTEQGLTVYVRYDCSLCDDMLAALRPLQQELGFALEIIEIGGDYQLEQLYGSRVPVLVAGRGELCHYFLDPDRVRGYFAAC